MKEICYLILLVGAVAFIRTLYTYFNKARSIYKADKEEFYYHFWSYVLLGQWMFLFYVAYRFIAHHIFHDYSDMDSDSESSGSGAFATTILFFWVFYYLRKHCGKLAKERGEGD